MKDILIIAHFAELPEENDNCRFVYFSKVLMGRGNKVEIIGSSFCHTQKRQRISNSLKYFTTIYEPGYKKNVSLKRLFSHKVLAKNLKQYLSKRKKPDVIYCAVPSLDVAEVAARYAKENNIEFIIDIQDLWPEAFKMVFSIPVISNIVFGPMKRKADRIYKNADKIIAVSETYKSRAELVNNKARNNISVFLGTELERFDRMVDNIEVKKKTNEFWIAYVGTLGHSYDLRFVIDAISIVNESMENSIKFVVMGDGPLGDSFKTYAEKKGVVAWFTGRLPYSEMVSILAKCDIAVNPISKGAAQSIINKVGDYAAAGLPVVNTQECIEYRQLIEEYGCGYNCDNSDAADLANKIERLYIDSQLRVRMGYKNRQLAEEKFDRKKTYEDMADIVLAK